MPYPRCLQAGGDGFYRCVSRVVDRRLVFDTTEKRHFRKWMRKLETFCGVAGDHLLIDGPKPRPSALRVALAGDLCRRCPSGGSIV